jgi:hypothetical protein
MALSIFATQRERYESAAMLLQDEVDKATDSEKASLYGRAWAQAFTAARHLQLAENNSKAADFARSTAAGFGRQRAAADNARQRASELDLVAQRHRVAAEKASEKALEIEREAKGEGQPAQDAAGRRGGQPVMRRPPTPTPPRGQQAPQRQQPPRQPPQQPPRAQQAPAPPPAAPAPQSPPPAPAPASAGAVTRPGSAPPTSMPRGGDDGDGE